MERINRDTYVLSTGRKVYANQGLISIANQDGIPYGAANDGPFDLRQGYDGSLDDDEAWTVAEKIELAEFMIAQWRAFLAFHTRDEPREDR